MGILTACSETHTSQLEQPGSRVDSDHQSMPLQQAMEGDLLSPTMIQPEGRMGGEWESQFSTLNSGHRTEKTKQKQINKIKRQTDVTNMKERVARKQKLKTKRKQYRIIRTQQDKRT